AVEDPDLSARRQALLIAAEEVLAELARRRDLEALDAHALRVDAAHHVADRPVLAGSVERLENDENAPRVLGGEPSLVLLEQLDALRHEIGAVLLLLDPRLEGGIEIPLELHLRARGDPERLDDRRYSLRDVAHDGPRCAARR